MGVEKERVRISLASFDLIKGLAMICVVIGHATFHYNMENVYFFRTLVSKPPEVGFLMPMFFIISGYTFKEKSPGKILKTTFKQLIVPYVIVMVIYVLLYPLTFYLAYHGWSYGLYEDALYLIAFLLGIPTPGKILFGHTMYHCSAVWFFLALFIATNVLNLILKTKLKSKRGTDIFQFILVLLFTFAGYIIVLYDFNFYCLPQGLMAISPMYLGYMLKKHKLMDKAMYSVWTYVVLVPVMAIHFTWGYMDLARGIFSHGIATYFLGCGSGLLLIILSLHLNRYEWKILNLIRIIGTYTYWIICIHVIENGCMHWWAFADAIGNDNAYFLEILIKAVIITFFCIVLKKATKYRYKRKIIKVQV